MMNVEPQDFKVKWLWGFSDQSNSSLKQIFLSLSNCILPQNTTVRNFDTMFPLYAYNI